MMDRLHDILWRWERDGFRAPWEPLLEFAQEGWRLLVTPPEDDE